MAIETSIVCVHTVAGERIIHTAVAVDFRSPIIRRPAQLVETRHPTAEILPLA